MPCVPEFKTAECSWFRPVVIGLRRLVVYEVTPADHEHFESFTWLCMKARIGCLDLCKAHRRGRPCSPGDFLNIGSQTTHGNLSVQSPPRVFAESEKERPRQISFMVHQVSFVWRGFRLCNVLLRCFFSSFAVLKHWWSSSADSRQGGPVDDTAINTISLLLIWAEN